MKALIVDDETSNLENLRQLLNTYADDVEIIAVAGSVAEGVAAVQKHRPELVFLDIQLHGQSGFDMLRELNEINFAIIFVTAYDQYGIQAIKFAALDYLLKPIDIDDLKAALTKARKAIQQTKKNDRLDHLLEYLKDDKQVSPRIALPMFGETRYVNVSDIIHCEADNTYTHFFLKDGERVLVSKTLKDYSEMLAPHGFLRTHQTHLVNTEYIKSWIREDGGSLLLKDNTKIPISKVNRVKVKDMLAAQFKL